MHQVQCEHCGHRFDIDESVAADSITCPSCDAFTALPPAAVPAVERPKLELKRDEVISPAHKRCPLCDSTTPADAVICVKCGYDWRHGRSHAAPKAGVAFLRNALPLVLLVAVVAIGAYIYLQRRAATPAEALPAPGEVAEPPPSETPAVEPATPTAESAAEAAETSAEPDAASMAGVLLDRFSAELDGRLPMFEKNDDVALRRSNGIIARGQYVGATRDVALLLGEEGTLEVPLKELDRPSRLRSDRDFRERYLDYLVQKRLQQLEGMPPEPAAP